MDEMTTRHCSDCGTVTLFAVVPCMDGHGEDCPDLSCVECGLALVLAVRLDVLVGAVAA